MLIGNVLSRRGTAHRYYVWKGLTPKETMRKNLHPKLLEVPRKVEIEGPTPPLVLPKRPRLTPKQGEQQTLKREWEVRLLLLFRQVERH